MNQAQSADRWNDLLRVTRSWRLEWKLSQLLERVAREAAEFLQMERGAVFLLGAEGLSRRACWPVSNAKDPEAIDVARNVIRKGRPVFAHFLQKKIRASRKRSSHAVCCVPLTASRGILGTLYVDTTNPSRSLPQQDQEFLEMLGLQAAVAIEHALLYQSAITDPLTGLFSHRHFQQEVEQAVRRSRRTRKSLALIILDLDKFKQLNDARGHDVGNQCLVQVAKILRESVRVTDVIARFGGDEFELLLPDSGGGDAANVAEKIRRGVARMQFEPRVGSSAGVAAFPENAADAQSLFLRADEALYEAKEAGRNRVKRSSAKPESAEEPPTAPDAFSDVLELSPPPVALPEPASNGGNAAGDGGAELIDGHRVVKRLGMGSAGEVLLVRQPELEREVALKRPLTPHLTEDQRQAFENEAKATAALSHPGVVTVHTMGRDADGRQYYTMKPLNGPSLGQILQSLARNDREMARRYSQRRLLEILQRVAETIAYAHDSGSVHLDLNPHNIVVGQFGEATVIDWGTGASSMGRAARRSNGSGRLKYLVGSTGYAAPEQLPGSLRKTGMPTDVHALGAILYEILTRTAPYRRADSRATIHAIMAAPVAPPEKVAPKASIDPLLSALCLSALQRDPARRPTAAEFAQRLGRYVRRDVDTTYRKFEGRRLNLKDWIIGRGDWSIRKNALHNATHDGGMIYLNTPIPGNFRVVCDAWAERDAELAIVARNKGATTHPWGVEFKFGAEWNTCSRLLHPHLSQVIPNLRMTPHRRYRLMFAYEDGWYTGQIDGKTVVELREPFFVPGTYMGFSTWNAGVYFRPIELEWQNWGPTIPLMRMADEMMGSKNYDRAAELYREISSRMAGSFESSEAIFKLAMCEQWMNRRGRARKLYLSLKGTSLEAIATAELTQMEFATETLDGARRGLKLLRRAAPREQTVRSRWGYVVTVKGAQYGRKTELIRAEVLRIRRDSHSYRTMPEVDAQAYRLFTLLRLGQWQRAVTEAVEFDKTVPQVLRHYWLYEPALVGAVLASGRDDLLPRDAFALHKWLVTTQDWSGGIAEHVVVRTGSARSFLRGHARGRRALDALQTPFGPFTAFAVNLSLRRVPQALKLLEELTPEKQEGAMLQIISAAVADSLDEKLFKAWIDRCERAPKKRREPLERYVVLTRAREALGRGLLKEAGAILKDAPPDAWQRLFHDLPLMQALTGSLGSFPRTSLRQFKRLTEQCMSGPSREFARMVLGVQPPVPGPVWPHRFWRPELRLWLALWLEARGRRKQAHAVATEAIDPRYGLLHCQPALAALVKRTR